MFPASFQILSRPRQGQEPFSILQGTDEVIRHLKKLLVVGETGLGYLGADWWVPCAVFLGGLSPPVLSGMTFHSGARLSMLVLRNILPILGARSPGFRSQLCCSLACGVF